MALVQLDEGHRVVPGDVLFASGMTTDGGACESEDAFVVTAGVGATVRRCLRRGRDAETAISLERRVTATRVGIVHWSEDGQQVSVVSTAPAPLAKPSDSAALRSVSTTEVQPTSSSSEGDILCDVALGAKPGDAVHLRVTRITPTFATGDVIAIRGSWCCNRSGTFAGFRGMLRAEDIKPFKPTKDKLVADPPGESMRPGDVVVATVISQTDAKVYQLSTIPEHCGVVDSTVPLEEGLQPPSDGSATFNVSKDTIPSVRPFKHRVSLVPVPFKRTIMKHPQTGAAYKKWTPLVQ